MSAYFDADAEPGYEQYKLDSSGYGLLTAAEERTLATRIQAGDSEAMETLVRHNLRLVASIARHYTKHGMDLLDLIQEGNIGLVRAAQKYDPARRTRFSTHATWWIRQAVRRAVMERGTCIHTPSYAAERIGKVHRVAARLAAQLGHDPTDAEIAAAASLSLQAVQDAHMWYATVRTPRSLDRPLDDDLHGLCDVLEDVRVPDAGTLATALDLRDAIEQALTQLPPREQAVIRARFGLDDDGHKTLRTVGEEFGVSRERIRQIEAKALQLLKPHLAHLVQEVAQ